MRETGWLQQVFADATQRIENLPQWKKETEIRKEHDQSLGAKPFQSSENEENSDGGLVEPKRERSTNKVRAAAG
jgi:hypothetical protein